MEESNLVDIDHPAVSRPIPPKTNWFFRISKWVMAFISRQRGLAWLEIGLIVAWAFWVGRGYLQFSTFYWPSGDENAITTQANFIWPLLWKCGACVMWNGYINGGAPAFAELMASVLHPLTIITSLLWGVFNGTKLLIIGSLAIAGLGQWWLARTMKLGWVARLWGAVVVILGGHLMCKMSNGALPLVTSLATASLILAPGIDLGLTGRRSSSVLLGIALALTWLSGSGYTQVAVVMGVIPAFVIFLFDENWRIKPVWKEYLLAFVLSFLLAAVLLVPLLHLRPYIVKDSDPYMTGFPPLQYNPLNLVISDLKFFSTEVLGHSLNTYHYFIYIGWVPVLLAFLSLRLAPKSMNRVLAYCWGSIGLIFLICSADLMQKLLPVIPQVSYLRYLYITSGLVVPYVVGLGALGLDQLLKLKWPKIGLYSPMGKSTGLSLAWLVVIIPVFWSVKPAYDMAPLWLSNIHLEVPWDIIHAMTPPTTEYVAPPSLEYDWIPVLLNQGLKLTNVFRPWRWADRQPPKPYLEASRNPDPNYASDVTGVFDDLTIMRHPNGEYALVQNGAEMYPCQANALGGNIDVKCTNATDGVLTVYENQFSGWTVKIDGKPASFLDSTWLVVNAPAGTHTYTFRYRPWDVPLGLFLTLVGIGLSIWMVFPHKQEPV